MKVNKLRKKENQIINDPFSKKAIKSNEYPSKTQIPKYSFLDTYIIKKIIGLKNSHLRNEFFRCLNNSYSIKIENQF